jgi:hypothetical protein
MYTKNMRAGVFCAYAQAKGQLAKVLRWQFPSDIYKPVQSVKFPGPNHIKAAQEAGSTQDQSVSFNPST